MDSDCGTFRCTSTSGFWHLHIWMELRIQTDWGLWLCMSWLSCRSCSIIVFYWMCCDVCFKDPWPGWSRLFLCPCLCQVHGDGSNFVIFQYTSNIFKRFSQKSLNISLPGTSGTPSSSVKGLPTPCCPLRLRRRSAKCSWDCMNGWSPSQISTENSAKTHLASHQAAAACHQTLQPAPPCKVFGRQKCRNLWPPTSGTSLN